MPTFASCAAYVSIVIVVVLLLIKTSGRISAAAVCQLLE